MTEKGGLSLRGGAFMTVLAALTVLAVLERTLPLLVLQNIVSRDDRGGFDGCGGCGGSGRDGYPLKLSPPFPWSWIWCDMRACTRAKLFRTKFKRVTVSVSFGEINLENKTGACKFFCCKGKDARTSSPQQGGKKTTPNNLKTNLKGAYFMLVLKALLGASLKLTSENENKI